MCLPHILSIFFLNRVIGLHWKISYKLSSSRKVSLKWAFRIIKNWKCLLIKCFLIRSNLRVVSNKAKGWISKRWLQENNARFVYGQIGDNEGINISVLVHWKYLQNNQSFKNTEMDETRIIKREKGK